jgi:hypothetical protein
MKNFLSKYFHVCPKTGRLKGLKSFNGFSKFLLPFIGLAAMIWILIRVIPKPSRLSYPCVRTAMPIASGFIGYLAMLALSALAFFKSKKSIRYFPVFFLGAFLVFGISGFYLTGTNVLHKDVELTVNATVNPNEPIGVAKGIFPGRVVWVHNPDATNENFVPSSSDGYFLPANYNQAATDRMVSTAIQTLTGQGTDSAAWRAIFEFHNSTRGKGAVNYSPGEKIFIKTNAVSAWWGNYSSSDLSRTQSQYYNVTETSPGFVLSVLRQLVNVAGVAQQDIYIGDPLRHIYKHCYDLWHGEFPNVHYLDNSITTLGREKVVVSPTAKISYSDRGAVLRDNQNYTYGTNPIYRDQLYTIFDEAEYIVNLPILKGHKRAGMTMFAKNNFGSHTRDAASHLHNGLIAPQEMENGIDRPGYGLYRVQVDMMSHSLLGKKNLVFLADALWSTSYELNSPVKWQMAPFNNSYCSSIFASFDNVAIESVGYDFLRSEFTVARGAGAYVQMDGVDDYLHQAADSTNWPNDIRYDPDSNGVHIYSLGVHEHWNNASDRQYSRNLGTGTGIELLEIEQTSSSSVANQDNRPVQYYELSQNYPNPFNPSTMIKFNMQKTGNAVIKIYDMSGREIETILNGQVAAGYHEVRWNANNLSSGVYFYRMQAGKFTETKKMVFQK